VRDPASTIKLDGREFHGITLTTNQDDYIIGHLSLSGALEVLGDVDEKRAPKKRYQDLLTRILLSGRKQHILAGMLTEVGKKWTRAEADRNAAAFAEITDEDEKTTIHAAILRFVLSFLEGRKKASASAGNFKEPTWPTTEIPKYV
jgi:hypothetical protein